MNFTVRPIAIAAAILLSGAASLSNAQEVRRSYIVQLQAEPAATYKGGISGLQATQPAPGAAFDYSALKVQNYVKYLGTKQGEVLATIANAPVIAKYDVVLNGFAAMLTDSEVMTLKMNPAVADIQADQARSLDTVTTADFLGLTKAGGLFSQYAGGSLLKGENMVVGIIDGGIWPENPSFADRVDANGNPTFDASGTLAYTSAPASFKGICQAGEGFVPAKHCNNKLIGAQYFIAGFQAANLPFNWTDYVSPRDSNNGFDGTSSGHGGHGDHTAATAAGNANVSTIVNGLPMGMATGVAPRARVSSYKVCWTYDDTTNPDGSNARNSCFNADTVAAIDAAVKDGVNVINYSISGSQSSSGDAVEQAFYRASLANVFVAASAGNSGPNNQVAHISPWLTTVAASTHDRAYFAEIILGSGVKYNGATATAPLPSTPMIRAEDAGMDGKTAALCYKAAPGNGNALLDPAKVAGKIVVCTRGDNARTDKSEAVKNAGGVGMILTDNGAGVVSEPHVIPTIHVSLADGAAIKTYVVNAAAAASASFGQKYFQPKASPIMANFSSRGPNKGDPNVLKPDLTAPGVDVIAAVTPDMTPAEHAALVAGTFTPPAAYASYQGTSMSSPHVAGLALLLRQAHPTWSPAAVKSALMTTAYSTLIDPTIGAASLLPWAQGAGHVDPNKAVDPGLVYDAGKADFVKYQCKVNRALVTPASDCTTFGTLDETYNLNLPSITVSSVQGNATVQRRVTNVGSSTATYNATASLPGFDVLVTPAQLTLAPGATGSFQVKLTATTAAANVWQFGNLTWKDGTHEVKIPVSAKVGAAITAPAEITSDKLSGNKMFLVKTAFSGQMGHVKGGLKEATVGEQVNMTAGALSSANLKLACQAGVNTASVRVYPVTVPAGTLVARFALHQVDGGATDDHDMGLLSPTGVWTYSGNDGSEELVQSIRPAAGEYKVCVNAYGSADPVMKHKLTSWVVTTSDVGYKFVVGIPGKVVAGYNTTVAMAWSGLQLNKRYLGAALFLDAAQVPRAATTLLIQTGTASIPTATAEKVVPKAMMAE